MASQGGGKRRSLPDGWLDDVRREGYCAANMGPLSDADLLRVARSLSRLGEKLAPPEVVDLTFSPLSAYLTQSRGAVPFHNDGVYRALPPRYLILYCRTPATRGGDTLLARAADALARLPPGLRRTLRRTEFRIEHEGTRITRRLIAEHPRDGTPGLFVVDPAISENFRVTAGGGVRVDRILDQIRAVLRKPALVCHRQRWRRDDVLIFDNFRVLHARTAYEGGRFLKRVEVFGRARGRW